MIASTCRHSFRYLVLALTLCGSAANISAQIAQPVPGEPRSPKVPAVVSKELPNGLTVSVVQSRNVPLVTINLFLHAGAALEELEEAGIADLTVSLLTKGTKTRTATQIAEQIEFLGGSISANAGWNGAAVTITVTADKVPQAMAILSDVILNPVFSQKEIDLLKSQNLDGLTYNLKQPGFLAGYVASKYVFREHPAGGTPESIPKITRRAVRAFYREYYVPGTSALIFTGDIAPATARSLTVRYFGRWKDARKEIIQSILSSPTLPLERLFSVQPQKIGRILVIDLPNSGQASVNYGKKFGPGRIELGPGATRVNEAYYPAIAFNSILGGGYSSRLNYEIRIKRGLSYGAGSSITWRFDASNFLTGAQTKNESAPEVATLVLAELEKLVNSEVETNELLPRKSVLTGNFGRNIETTTGLANALGELYSHNLPFSELNSYTDRVNAVKASQIRSFASQNLLGGDIIIVGDYSIFRDDLAKRFPRIKIDVIKADELDLSKDDLRK